MTDESAPAEGQPISENNENMENEEQFDARDPFKDPTEKRKAFIMNEFDHKAFLLENDLMDKKVIYLHDIEDMKEMMLSNLNEELVPIYTMYLEAAKGWVMLTYYELAKQELFDIFIRLQLLRSVGGGERDRQYGQLRMQRQITNDELRMNKEEQEEPGIIGNLVKKMRGGK